MTGSARNPESISTVVANFIWASAAPSFVIMDSGLAGFVGAPE